MDVDIQSILCFHILLSCSCKTIAVNLSHMILYYRTVNAILLMYHHHLNYGEVKVSSRGFHGFEG